MKIYYLLFLLSLVSCSSIKKCYKKALLTQYWVPKEGERDMYNDGTMITLDGKKSKKLKTTSGKTIAHVSVKTYKKFQMEGTGLLKSGVMVNLDSTRDTFMVVNRHKAPYGLGSSDSISLVPWISVASNDIKRGTRLYIKQLDGLKLPNGKTHNGCVRVDDHAWSFHTCQLDFFVLEFAAYMKLRDKLPEKVTVSQKNCRIQNYITNLDKKWAML